MIGPYTWQPYSKDFVGQHQWALEHIMAEHGSLGACYPLRLFDTGMLGFLEGGGTIGWMGLVQKGVYDLDHPHWGGFSGRFTEKKIENFWSRHREVKLYEETLDGFYVYRTASDKWTDPQSGRTVDNIYAPVWRWRQAMFNDFKCRMDWCVESYENANHHPVAAFNGDTADTIVFASAKAGEKLQLDASASKDPDGDELQYFWWMYKEPGTYKGDVEIAEPKYAKTDVTIPKDAAGKQIHIILEVADKNKIASLYDYRRIVIDVE